jgi:hypothetical protein
MAQAIKKRSSCSGRMDNSTRRVALHPLLSFAQACPTPLVDRMRIVAEWTAERHFSCCRFHLATKLFVWDPVAAHTTWKSALCFPQLSGCPCPLGTYPDRSGGPARHTDHRLMMCIGLEISLPLLATLTMYRPSASNRLFKLVA